MVIYFHFCKVPIIVYSINKLVWQNCSYFQPLRNVFLGNAEKLIEMILSIPEHCANIHNFPHNKYHKVRKVTIDDCVVIRIRIRMDLH